MGRAENTVAAPLHRELPFSLPRGVPGCPDPHGKGPTSTAPFEELGVALVIDTEVELVGKRDEIYADIGKPRA